MKQLDLSELPQAEKDERLAAAVTSYGVGTRSYNKSAEKKESDRQRAEATAKYLESQRTAVTVVLRCDCRSFNLPHNIERHSELRDELDWRTEVERRGIQRFSERVR